MYFAMCTYADADPSPASHGCDYIGLYEREDQAIKAAASDFALFWDFWDQYTVDVWNVGDEFNRVEDALRAYSSDYKAGDVMHAYRGR